MVIGTALLTVPDKLLELVSEAGLDFAAFSEASGGFLISITDACGIAMIVLGGILSIIAFFGFFGACCENKCMLSTYATLMIVIIVVEIALIILVVVHPKELKTYAVEVIRKSLTGGFKSDVSVDNDTFEYSTNLLSTAWMAIQFQLECCGAVNYTDYNMFNWTKFKCTGSTCPGGLPSAYLVPISCCKLRRHGGHIPRSIDEFFYLGSCLIYADELSTNHNSCATKIVDRTMSFIRAYSKVVIGMTVVIVTIEVMLVVLAFVLCCRISFAEMYQKRRRKKEEDKVHALRRSLGDGISQKLIDQE